VRDRYPGFYPPADHELEELWTRGLIVLDANTLLNLYRYSDETRDEFLDLLRNNAQRLWLPYQVGLEFQNNRLGVIEQQASAYEAVIKTIKGAELAVSAELLKYKKHSTMSAQELVDHYHRAVTPILNTLISARDSHLARAPSRVEIDLVWQAVTSLFDGRVGEPFSDEELKKIYDEGRARYAEKTPPGYEDEKKGEPRCYGDLVLWKELLRKAEEQQSTAIFVTDDGKEDWWRIVHGQTLGPRVELVEEFRTRAQKRIHFYSPEQFLRYAKERFSAKISESSLGEVERISSLQAHDHVRNVVNARRDELLQRRRSLEDSLVRTSKSVQRDDRISDLRNRERALMDNLAEMRDQQLKNQQLLTKVERVIARPTDESGEAKRFASIRDELVKSAESLGEQIADHEEKLRRVHWLAQSLDDDTTSRPSRLARLQSQIDEVDAALKETDRALAGLESDDGATASSH
jgi:hypothetical protein